MLSINRRQLIQSATAVAATQALPSFSQNYPDRPIRLIVPWPAGGLVDVAARQLATRMQSSLGQPMVVENRAGAGGNLGADQVVKAVADGHTLLFTTSALTMGTALRTKMPFDAMKDLEPVALVAHAPSVLVTGPKQTVNTVQELNALIRRSPGRLSYASAGHGSPAHFSGELYKTLMNLFVVHIPYTGAPGAMNDQLAGLIDYQFANATVALPQIRAGKVKALAVTSAKRFAALPNVPTMTESGVLGFEADQWLGLLAPKNIAPSVLEKLNAEASKAMQMEDFRTALGNAGMTVSVPSRADAFARYMAQDLSKWRSVVKSANIQAE